MAIENNSLSLRNSLLRRVQKHRSMSIIFRAVEIESPPMPYGVQPSTMPVVRAALASPDSLHTAAAVPAVAAYAPASPPTSATPSVSPLPPPTLPTAPPQTATKPPTAVPSAPVSSVPAPPIQRQPAVTPPSPLVQPPAPAAPTPAHEASDDSFPKPEWDRLSTILRKHEEKHVAGEDKPAETLADRVEAPWLKKMARKHERDTSAKPTVKPHERPKPKMPSKNMVQRRRPQVQYVGDENSEQTTPAAAVPPSSPAAAEPPPVQREPTTNAAEVQAQQEIGQGKPPESPATQRAVDAPLVASVKPTAAKADLDEASPADPKPLLETPVESKQLNDRQTAIASQVVDAEPSSEGVFEDSPEITVPAEPEMVQRDVLDTAESAPTVNELPTTMAQDRSPEVVMPPETIARTAAVTETAQPASETKATRLPTETLPDIGEVAIQESVQADSSGRVEVPSGQPDLIQRTETTSSSTLPPSNTPLLPAQSDERAASEPAAFVGQPAAADAGDGFEEAPDTAESDDSFQPLPLQDVWPVEKVASPPPMKAPELIQPMTITPPREEMIRRQPQDDERVREHLEQVAAEQSSDSSIELVLPRRPRPILPKNKMAQRQIQPDVEPKPPLAQQEVPTDITPPLVETEIGQLPGDLWHLLGQAPPTRTAPAEPAAPVKAASSEAPPVTYIPPTPQESAGSAPAAVNIPAVQREAQASPPTTRPPLADMATTGFGDVLPTIQRMESIGAGANRPVPSQEASSLNRAAPATEEAATDEAEQEEAAAPEIDIDTLAQQVYQALKRRLQFDRERNGRL